MSEEALSTPLDDTLASHVLDVLLRDDDRYDPTADRAKPKVLEVAQVFGDAVVDLKHFAAGREVSLGATVTRNLRGSRLAEDFFVPTVDLAASTHTLFEVDGQAWACVLPTGAEAFVDGPDGRRVLTGRLVLGGDDRVVIQIGESIFVARPVFQSKRVVVTRADSIDYPLLGITGFMGFVAMMMGVALSMMPPSPASSKMTTDRSITELLLRLPPKEVVQQTAQSSPSGEKAKGREGERGKPDSTERESRTLKPHPRDADVASEAGILGALQNNDALETTLGDSALPATLQAGVGGLIGPRATQMGAGGLGQRGSGFGGGGRADSMGGFGPNGDGRGSCVASGRCGPVEVGGGKPPSGELTLPSDGIIIGGLDKSLIDQVIKRNLSQIRYCYQRELTKNPNLGGKVSVKFVIANDGSVSSATTKSSTLASPAAESCINARFLHMTFPQPKGGGIVIVSYPFLFAPG